MYKKLEKWKIYNIIAKYNKGYSTHEIAKVCNISQAAVYNVLKRKGIKIRSISEAQRIKNIKKDRKVGGRRKIIELPYTENDLNNEAEIIGMIMGDGHIGRYSISFGVGEKDFAESFIKLVRMTYGIDVYMKDRSNIYECVVHSVILVERIRKLTKNNKILPEHILKGSNRMKARFVRGFVDAEGSVEDLHNRRQIVISQKGTWLLTSIQKILYDLGIQSNFYRKRFQNNHLVISLLRNLEKYSTLIGFSIKEKKNKLNKAIKYLKKCKTYESSKYWEVLRHWLKSKKSLRASAQEANVQYETYRQWIYGKKSPCQIKKDIKFRLIPEDYNDLREQYDFLPYINES